MGEIFLNIFLRKRRRKNRGGGGGGGGVCILYIKFFSQLLQTDKCCGSELL